MAMHRPDQIRAYFDRIGFAEWDRFDRSPVEKVKLHLHEVYLRRHLPTGARVLEIGAGPGRFTRVLVEHGCRVVVTDLSPVQLELNRATAAPCWLPISSGLDAMGYAALR
jgi:cyclopropane fatty-acyl-phospholipid synthase-like methyltransferase